MRREKPRALTRCSVFCPRIASPLRLLLLADLHGDLRQEELSPWREEKPDLILLPGDTLDGGEPPAQTERIRRCLTELCTAAPVYASLGNHEAQYHIKRRFVPPASQNPLPLLPMAEKCRDFLASCGVRVLHDEAVTLALGGTRLCLGGLTSAPALCPGTPAPDVTADYSLLLCHHPEYFDTYIAPTAWSLTLSGHAHGGQWRIGSRGIFAPGQGFFPKYTGGFYADSRLLVSRGMASRYYIPRFFNAPEAILLTLLPSGSDTVKEWAK